MNIKSILTIWLLAVGGTSLAYADQTIQMITIPGMHFEIGKYEVTQGQWEVVMGNNPSHFNHCGDNCPVENVSWNDAQEFIQRLNTLTAKQYRLPNEDEWDYACHGGTDGDYCGGNDVNELGWHGGNSAAQTHSVGLKKHNGYGLYDMTGNVWEWVQDKYGSQSDLRVLRGGSWGNAAQRIRSANRGVDAPAKIGNSFGFRLARTLP